jgi:hypothetical protein
MPTKADLLEELHDLGVMVDWLEKRNNELNEIIARKTAIIDAIVFKDKEKLNNIKDFDAYQEFMSSIFDAPIRKTNC